MAEVDPPEQLQPHQPQLFNSIFLTGPQSPTHPSVISLSDSESESCDLDPKPIFEPDHDHLLNHHHQHHRQHHHHEQVSFFTNLIQRSSSQNAVISGSAIGLGLGLGSGDPNCRNSGDGEGKFDVDLELGLGLGIGFGNNDEVNLRQPIDETRRIGGLRVVNIDDESDSESEDEVLRNDCCDGIHDDDDDRQLGFGGVSDFDRPPYCWDYLGFNNGNRVENGGVPYVEERVSDGESVVNDNFDEFFIEEDVVVVDEDDDDVDTPIQLDTDVSNVFDTYQMRAEQQEIAVDSDTDEGGEFGGVEEAIRDLEWEILLAVNNFNREVYDMDFNVDMYETILGEVEDRMNDWRGSPPAAESVIEELPSVSVFLDGKGEKSENEVLCAICKDEVLPEELLKQLPCLHYYHTDCIVPWLRMRNTCPVCRFELPTDDAEYECRKREREREEELNVDASQDLSQDSQESWSELETEVALGDKNERAMCPGLKFFAMHQPNKL